jgi:predicted DNA-binding protein YlxM (UPF0122 family)
MENKITERESIKDLSEQITRLVSSLSKFLIDLGYGKLDELSINELAELQKVIKEDIEAIKTVETTLGKYFDIIRKTKLPELMHEQDIKGIAIAGVGRVSLVDDIYASIKKDQQSEAQQWLDDHGHGDLIRETVHPSSLKALLKSKLKEGEEIPEDLFKVTPYTYSKILTEKPTK